MKTIIAFGVIAATAFGSNAMAASSHHSSRHKAHQQTVANDPKERIGTLSCEVAGGVGFLVGSKKDVSCQFRQRTGRVERYTGSIGKLGLDVGFTGKTYMTWLVYNVEPTSVGDRALAGTYVGASASAAAGIGLGANALVGGSGKNFGLQPLSGEVGTGLNVAAGVSRLQLRPAG